MMTPAWILDAFAALMLVVAAVSAARLGAARPWERGPAVSDTDISHLLMAIAMAGTLASSLTTLPNAAWEIIFGLLTFWFGYRVMRDARANGVRALAGGHCAPHLVHSAAMLYMFVALAAPASGRGQGMAGMGGSSGPAMQTLEYPTLAFVFALILVGYTVWDLDQLSGRRYSLTSPGVSPARAAPAGVPAMAGAESGAVAFSAAPAGDVAAAGDLAAAGDVAAAGDAAATDAGSGRSPAGAPAAAGGAPGGGRTPRTPRTARTARGVLLSGGMTVGCRIAMGVTMAFMLLIMI